jgi:uncharacterized repeat protein (TIGR03943 family)
MTVDWGRAGRGLALLAWGAFFAYLWLTGRSTTYVGPRTTWVVTFGGILLPISSLAYLAGAARRGGGQRSGPPSIRDVAGLGVLIVPILFALMVPAPTLGALAMANKRGGLAPAVGGAPVNGRLRLYEIAWAGESARYAQENHIRAGEPVSFDGFVSRPLPGDMVEIARFLVTCCAADAVAYAVKVKPPPNAPGLTKDTWVHIQGRLTGVPGRTLTVTATGFDAMRRPSTPYS